MAKPLTRKTRAPFPDPQEVKDEAFTGIEIIANHKGDGRFNGSLSNYEDGNALTFESFMDEPLNILGMWISQIITHAPGKRVHLLIEPPPIN